METLLSVSLPRRRSGRLSRAPRGSRTSSAGRFRLCFGASELRKTAFSLETCCEFRLFTAPASEFFSARRKLPKRGPETFPRHPETLPRAPRGRSTSPLGGAPRRFRRSFLEATLSKTLEFVCARSRMLLEAASGCFRRRFGAPFRSPWVVFIATKAQAHTQTKVARSHLREATWGQIHKLSD